jgi:spore coat polysaccharide biosynthesis predicted glycosyltransferase SpsG
LKVAFRVDSADYIGMGHIVRCLTLAEKLRINGAEVFFVTRNHRNNYNEKILEKNFALLLLPRLNIKINNENYSSWLGISQVEEANQILEALKDHLIDWMIIDHYGISSKCESILKKYILKI